MCTVFRLNNFRTIRNSHAFIFLSSLLASFLRKLQYYCFSFWIYLYMRLCGAENFLTSIFKRYNHILLICRVINNHNCTPHHGCGCRLCVVFSVYVSGNVEANTLTVARRRRAHTAPSISVDRCKSKWSKRSRCQIEIEMLSDKNKIENFFTFSFPLPSTLIYRSNRRRKKSKCDWIFFDMRQPAAFICVVMRGTLIHTNEQRKDSLKMLFMFIG